VPCYSDSFLHAAPIPANAVPEADRLSLLCLAWFSCRQKPSPLQDRRYNNCKFAFSSSALVVDQLKIFVRKGVVMLNLPLYLWNDDSGQDIAEYAVMLAVILVLVVGTIRLVGSNANNAFSSVSSTLQ
jgi:Flp pilus assembly pilin Flp